MSRRVLLSLVAVVAAFALVASGPLSAAEPAAKTPVLVEIRAAHHPGYDRLVFEFDGPPPKEAKAYFAKKPLRLDPSNKLAHVKGGAHIKVVFRTAAAHELEPPYRSTVLPHRRAYNLPNIAHVVQLGDAEGDVSYGIGLMKKTRILRKTLLTKPPRFVLDVSTQFPKRAVKVFFIDETVLAGGGGDLVVPVTRKVPRYQKAKGALWRLWAGPTKAERARDLVFVDSGTTGHRKLRMQDNGVSRLTLNGPCQTDGAAITVADEILPTLKSLPKIKWVKISDASGTLYPTGKSDSLPGCLQP